MHKISFMTDLVHRGKICRSVLPLEIQLTRLISGIENPHESWTSSTPGCQWEGVSCERDLKTLSIHWDTLYSNRSSNPCLLQGFLKWEYLPVNTVQMRFSTNAITGTLDTSLLPLGLAVFDGYSNYVSGRLELDALPATLKELEVRRNSFMGPLVLTHLPHGMVSLLLGSNRFTGTVNLSALPRSLVQIDISRNELSGEVDFSFLHEGLWFLEMGQNKFSGVADLRNPPQSLEIIRLEPNAWKTKLSNCFEYSELDRGWKRVPE